MGQHLGDSHVMKNSVVFIGTVILLGLGGSGSHALAQDPLNPQLFQVGGYADEDRTLTCVTGAAGTIFEHSLWVWVPENSGLAYITIRFRFPDNIDLNSHPVFNDLVTGVIYTDYPEGTVEWNMIIADCPSGWFKVFTQECVLLNDELSKLAILGEFSMMRDCTFILNDVVVLNELLLNDPACSGVPVEELSWDCLKSCFSGDTVINLLR
jgi:hypothetical protein